MKTAHGVRPSIYASHARHSCGLPSSLGIDRSSLLSMLPRDGSKVRVTIQRSDVRMLEE